MPTKQKLALVAAMVAALLGSSGCVSRLATVEHHLTIERKVILNDDLRLGLHRNCVSTAQARGIPLDLVHVLPGCEDMYGNQEGSYRQ
jgi:hypothetical protein